MRTCRRLFAVLFFVLVSHASAADIEFHFVYVGQGDCTLIQTPDGKNVLVDCGTSRDGDADDVRAYIQNELGDDGKIDVLVVTHPDSDHYNLLPHVLQGIRVDSVLYVGTLDEYPSADFGTWLRNHPNKRRMRSSDADQPGHVSTLFPQGPVKFHVLAADVGDEKNTRSIVLMVRYEQFDVVLTGDATEETEEDILSRYGAGELDAELLKVGHHGSNTSTKDAWLQAVRPEMATVSAAYNSQYAHPRRTVIDRLANFTDAAPSHQFRWGVGSGNNARLRNVNDYREAIYSTATSESFVVKSDGTRFQTHGDEELLNPIAFNSNPRNVTASRSPIIPLESHIAKARPTDTADGRRGLVPGLRLSGSETPDIVPLEVGKPIEIVLRNGTKVSGTLKANPTPTWYHVTEADSSKTVFVRESDVAIVKQ